MIKVDNHAVVHPNAQIGDGCEIGPFCTIGPDVTLGTNNILRSHVVIEGHTEIGSGCEVFPFVTIGVQSQDKKFTGGNVTYTRVGNRNVIREFVSIHSGTDHETSTVIGDDCTLLTQSHVAHNCDVGDHVIISHSAAVAGHVSIGDHANVGSLAGIHQFCNIGTASMVAAMARVVQDVLPFTIAEGFPAKMRVINKIGMERAGYSRSQVAEVRKAFRILFMRELKLEDSISQLQNEFPESDHVQLIIDATNNSKKGLARPDDQMFPLT
ncbi:MAG: acyl-[acyl-carrier-protein]--UDP-N-acetylglucosamine O-acyltransferase [OM182 bacterium MED-G24]|uniref:Acyl-[acyl-carrier-protein]--UDP-N-acetylglucosamine O-acyltransferase n=1 Tax=OM182 bacterium MED-G24 TaxID=1986255 RepID=A0A2A5WS62_9GAMM|nr:MAG: acyl-[acyl-carrier-protein]--UDP-N-acetylglucosamine O-acyltransferase [OM182 bacterium MED-G24]|tara:strand:- start:317 stop:1120 length:804 start_codon:yes stop_codon:yes gene_type:complete